MRRRFFALLLGVLMICQLALPVAQAGTPKVYFTAVGESVLPLADSTMPFWHGGYLYIPSTMFTDNVWRILGISYIRNNQGVVILHTASQAAGRSLIFDLKRGFAEDSEGNIHYPGAVERGGIAFVPAYTVASFFNLQYSVIDVPHGHLVWLRSLDFGLSDKYFADAANYNMESSYNAYLKSKEKGKEPAQEQPDVAPEAPSFRGTGTYLCLAADGNTGEMLDVLERSRDFAAFFCTPSFMQEQDDLLRRMAASGHSIGIFVDPQDPQQTLEEQLEAGNLALEQATCSKTRLVYVKNGTEEDIQRIKAEGYQCLDPDMDRTEYTLKSLSNANSLAQRISNHSDSVSVWLGDTANADGLRYLLTAIHQAENQCLALTETAAA